MIVVYILAGVVIGFVGGYVTSMYWGKPAKELKKLKDKL